ncbi:MAG: hypothetical protein WCT01_02460 [Candidatus Shapirobacteria bacterium]
MIIKKDAADRLLLMLITAVGTVLLTRLFLELTGWWTLGKGEWHIAHVMYGGLFMTGAMIMAILFDWEKAGRRVMIVFGIGLGLFVDEMGKFLSKDNNYFFQPAVMLIYIFFMGIFLIYMWIKKEGNTSPWGKRWLAKWLRSKFKLGQWQVTRLILGTVLVIYAVGGLWDIALLVSRHHFENWWDFWTRNIDLSSRMDYRMLYAKFGSDLITSGFFLTGWWKLIKKQKNRAIDLFETGILVNIFFGQVFKFYLEQASAVLGLMVAGGLYYGLKWWKFEVRNPNPTL